MEACFSSNSSSKSAHSSQNPEEAKRLKHAYPFQSHSLLHSVRKSKAKPWKKAPVAPMPPTPIKVYNVDAINFRNLVQQLTGAPEFKPLPHHELIQSVARKAASPPIQNLSRRDLPQPECTNWYKDFQSEAFGVMKSQEITTDGAMTPGFLDISLSSPSSYSNWYSFLPSSPGTITSLEPGSVL